MFKDSDYVRAALHESTGSLGSLGVRVLVASFGVPLSEDDELIASHHCTQILEELYKSRIERDPETAKAKAETKQALLACFPSRHIYAEEIPNGYSSNCVYAGSPWFSVTTEQGRIKIGWRSKVISIDWSGSDIAGSAEEMFPDEPVTKYEKLIHAWGYEAATRYLARLLKPGEAAALGGREDPR